VAYLLLLAGLLLVVFELFTAGPGMAGAAGAIALVLASYGLATLPVRLGGLALLAVAVFGFSVDVQTGAPRVWTSIGAVALLAGSVLLYRGLALRWPALLVGVLGTALLMLGGLPATVRSRFAAPTVGRDSMVGEAGLAAAPLDPEGVVRIRGALWRARTNRATPIDEGADVRVVGIQGIVLEVEPAGATPDGASRDGV
jgi:membrane-bound serine protease (ClpP class)